ncbi:hypothetical protein ACGFNU_21515 [Spirillospora sp. NPDC048911]|uniref:hypothetical protein n=1 Tax=Spirillospora sp. NPDC048911 TaxID=3364527 RepID=UPI00371182F8
MSTNPLDEFARCPQTTTDVTAESLTRHMAVSAQRRVIIIDRLMEDTSPAGQLRYMDAIGLLVGEFSVVKLLRALSEHAPGMADEVAKDLWGDWEDGGAIGEWLWEWLAEYGIDAAQVSKVAGEMWDRHVAKQRTEAAA